MDVSTLSIENDPKLNRKVINKTYRIIKKIGEGQFGKVLLAENIGTQNSQKPCTTVAIKTINRLDKTRLITKTYLSHTTKIKREIQIMKECNHPNVVKLYQVIDDLKYDKILLVLEYCPFGEIDWKKYNHYNEKYNKKNGITINKILRDVVNGLEYLHDYKKIIHRDLKPSNLLISEDKTIKISDFGVSLILENNANDDKELGKSMGTPAFFAPELCQFVNNRLSMINDNFKAKNKIDSRIDLWSLGVILYCLIFNDLPFNGFNEFGLFKNIVNNDLKFPKVKSTNQTTKEDIKELKLLKDLIEKLLTKDPTKRITLDKVKRHGFTLFDISQQEQEKFLDFNHQIIRQDGSLTTKIKRLFVSKPESPVSPKIPIAEKEANVNDLEPVDELLDSYFDDSSSMGSIEDVHEVDTMNILGPYDSKQDNILRENSSTALVLQRRPTADQAEDGTSGEKPNNFLSLKSIADEEETMKRSKNIPSPLQLGQPIFQPYKSRSASSSSSFFQSPLSPSSPNVNAVTIGAASPSSIKSMFSPSKRFFSRNKSKESASPSKKKHTISSLSSTPSCASKGNEKKASTYNDFIEPPPLFGNAIPTQSTTQSSSAACSRKNSISSVRSGGLSRITSSSSSLNLNAYLTDDTYSLTSVKDSAASGRSKHSNKVFNEYLQNSTDDEIDMDETLIIQDEEQSEMKHYTTMSDLLDKL